MLADIKIFDKAYTELGFFNQTLPGQEPEIKRGALRGRLLKAYRKGS
jgi:hypothetical protein